MGTQGTKALLWESETGEVLGRGSVGYSLTSTRPGQAEQHPDTWVEVRPTLHWRAASPSVVLGVC